MKRTIEEQRSQRVARTATIICCSIFISTLITLIKSRILEGLDPSEAGTATLLTIASLVLCCCSGAAAGYGVKMLWQEPYEE